MDLKKKIKNENIIILNPKDEIVISEIEFLKNFDHIYRNILGLEMEFCLRSYSICMKATSIEWLYLLLYMLDDFLKFDSSIEFAPSEIFNPLFINKDKVEYFKISGLNKKHKKLDDKAVEYILKTHQ